MEESANLLMIMPAYSIANKPRVLGGCTLSTMSTSTMNIALPRDSKLSRVEEENHLMSRVAKILV